MSNSESGMDFESFIKFWNQIRIDSEVDFKEYIRTILSNIL